MGVINTINKSGTEAKQIESVKKKLLEDSEPFKVTFDEETFNMHKKREEMRTSRERLHMPRDQEDEEENQIDVINNESRPSTLDNGTLTKLLESLGNTDIFRFLVFDFGGLGLGLGMTCNQMTC